MLTLPIEQQTKTIRFVQQKNQKVRTKKVGDVLKELGLHTVGSGESQLSVHHDNLLYK